MPPPADPEDADAPSNRTLTLTLALTLTLTLTLNPNPNPNPNQVPSSYRSIQATPRGENLRQARILSTLDIASPRGPSYAGSYSPS